MKISTQTLTMLALVAGFALMGGDAMAANGTGGNAAAVGGTIVDTIQSAITGNVGLIIGLVLAVLGIYTWVVKQETAAGILLIIGGVLITITPGVFNALGGFVSPLINAAGGNGNVIGNTGAQLPK